MMIGRYWWSVGEELQMKTEFGCLVFKDGRGLE